MADQQPPQRDESAVVGWLVRDDDGLVLDFDDAIRSHLEGLLPYGLDGDDADEPTEFPPTLTLDAYQFPDMYDDVEAIAQDALDFVLETLDDMYQHRDAHTRPDPTESVHEAARTFIRAILEEYEPTLLVHAFSKEVDVATWVEQEGWDPTKAPRFVIEPIEEDS